MSHRLYPLLVSIAIVTTLAFLAPSLVAYGAQPMNRSLALATPDQPAPTPTSVTLAQPLADQDKAAPGLQAPAVYRLPAPVAELRQPLRAQDAQKQPPVASAPAAPTGYETILFEGFEGVFPYTGWTMFDLSNDGFERVWDDVSTRSYTGAWSGWPARGGIDGLDPSTAFYADNMDSWMVYGPFDLSNAIDANVSFAQWLATEACCDRVAFLVSRDGVNFDVYGQWSGSADWTDYNYNLTPYVGDDTVWVAWWFYSDGSVNDAGPFIDDILIEKYVEPCASTDGSYRCVKAVASTLEWQATGLTLQQGEEFSITYSNGDWTVGVYNWPYTGPAGYAPVIDEQINSACKTVDSLPYAMLLGRVGNETPFAVGEGGTFTANTNGPLALRINDEGWCMSDNRGAIVVGLENPDEYTLLTNTGGNGTVASEPARPFYTYNEQVTLTAVPDLGWSFANWSGDLTGNSNPAELTMDGNKNVTANFTQNQYTLSVNTIGNGNVAVSPTKTTYVYGEQVTLTATPISGWVFSGWGGALSGATNPTTLTMNGNKTVIGNFVQTVPNVQFSSDAFRFNEAAGVAAITVNLSVAFGQIVTVDYTANNGTASAGSDYTASSGTLIFNPNQTTKTFSVQLLDDAVDEPDETLSLTLRNPGAATLGAIVDATLTIIDNDDPPVAAFSATPLTGNKPLTVNFTNQSTGSITSWAWNFGDGGTSTEQSPAHIYNSAGNYTVSLTVTGPGGSNTKTQTNYIQISEPTPPPVANFIASPLTGNKPLTVNFTDQSTGSITGWAWNFGDGGTSTQQSPSHTYTSAGNYTVALTVSGPNGTNTKTAPNYIQVVEPPPANGPSLSFPEVATAPGSRVTLSASYTAKGNNISSLLFSIDYDQSRLTFDPADQNGDGIPEAIQFSSSLPSNLKTVAFAASDTTGELDFLIGDLSGSPRIVPDGVLFTITFVASANTAGAAFVNFTTTPAPSFGSASGDVAGSSDGGSILITGPPASAAISASATTLTLDDAGHASCEIFVVVRDAANNPVPNQNVTFTATLGNIAASATTDANGRAAATFAARGVPGTATVTVQAGNARGNVNIEIEAPSSLGELRLYLPIVRR